LPKHCGLLEIKYDKVDKENKFQIVHIPLKSCRQFLFDTVNLDEVMDIKNRQDADAVMEYCTRKVGDMISEAEIEHSGEEIQPKLPLIRLRVESSSTLPFSTHIFSLKFISKVANPDELILFKLKRKPRMTNLTDMDAAKLNQLTGDIDATKLTNIEDIVKEYFDEVEEKAQLRLINEKQVTLAVKEMVDKDNVDAVPEVIEILINKCREKLLDDPTLLVGGDRSEIEARIKEFRLDNEDGDSELLTAVRGASTSAGSKSKSQRSKSSRPLDSEEDYPSSGSEVEDSPKKPARGRGRGRAKR
jgi:double-strand break repair protein MRE11